MTKPMSAPVLSDSLDMLVKNPLNQVDDELLVSAAKEFWYSDLSLETALSSFLAKRPDNVAVRRVGYLFERLTRFACATDDRVSEALTALKLVSGARPAVAVPNTGVSSRRFDALAATWGLTEGLGLKAQALLPFQTRHYEATQRAVA
jgi:hypothetical protein